MDWLQWSIKFLLRKTSASSIKNQSVSSKELAEELHKPVTRRFNKRKIHYPFVDKIWGAYIADMKLISKFNKRI